MQIAAPSNEVTPPMSMVRFDWIGTGQNARFPVQTLRVVQGRTAAGNAEGSCTLIWYRPTCPGVKPTKTGASRMTGPVGGVGLITPPGDTRIVVGLAYPDPVKVIPWPNSGEEFIKAAQTEARSIRRMNSISDILEPKAVGRKQSARYTPS